MMIHSAAVRLNGFHCSATEEFTAAREVIQRVYVGAHVSAHGNGIGRGTHSARPDIISVLFRKTEKERRMRREVRHAHEIGLRKIVHAAIIQNT